MHAQSLSLPKIGIILAVLVAALFATVASPAYAVAATVTGVSPSSGSTAGGTAIVVTGSGFGTSGVPLVTAVDVGPNPATSFSVVNNTTLNVTTPAGVAGTVDIVVTTNVANTNTAADNFTYGAPPTVTLVSPNFCTAAGGTAITITGTNLSGATVVNFGAATATPSAVGATSITVTCPVSAVDGPVDVQVTTPFGQSANTVADNFTYTFGAPTVAAVSPRAGLIAGGTVVTITGTGFTGSPVVTFGGTNGTGVLVNNPTSITATAPAHAAGIVDVIVQTTNGTSTNTAADDYFYGAAAPAVTGIAPTGGPIAGGTVVIITGTNLGGATGVTFDGLAATVVTVNSSTQVSATSPAHAAGAANVIVTSALGVSTNTSADDFTYTNVPVVTGVAPGTGPIGGATVVVLTGTGFTGATSVTFGGTAGTGLVVNSNTTITVVSPAHAAGTVDILVTTPLGTSANTVADNFVYGGGPNITLISPSTGPIVGGTTVTITGTGFTGATAVSFGATPATSFTVVSDTSITAVSPVGVNGVVRLTVVTPTGTSPDTTADNFTYGTGSTTTFTLYFRWTLIVWNGKDLADITNALKGQENPDNPNTNDISSVVTAIFHYNNPLQKFEGFFPGSAGVPGANDFTTFKKGEAYWVAISSTGTLTWTTLAD